MVCDQREVKKKGVYYQSELKKMAEDKHLDEKAKKHWRHKPYKCDFGGAKDETLRQ